MRDVDAEPGLAFKPPDEVFDLVAAQLDMATARLAVEMTVLVGRPNVVLLAAAGAVAMPDQPELLEHVERPIDGRRHTPTIERSASLDDRRTREMTVARSQHLDDAAALRSPSQPTTAELVAR